MTVAVVSPCQNCNCSNNNNRVIILTTRRTVISVLITVPSQTSSTFLSPRVASGGKIAKSIPPTSSTSIGESVSQHRSFALAAQFKFILKLCASPSTAPLEQSLDLNLYLSCYIEKSTLDNSQEINPPIGYRMSVDTKEFIEIKALRSFRY